MSNATYLVGAGFDASTAHGFSGDRRRPAGRSTARSASRPQQNDFAAMKSGLDSTRSQFYGSSGTMPNSRADATRRQRSLVGGSGDRMLTDLDLWTERAISRMLAEQSPLYGGMIETWACECIQTGFRLKPDTGNANLNVLLKELLCGWDGDGGWMNECDARGLMHFWDLMTLSEETELRDGDHALFLDPEGNNRRGSIAIIEGDRILTPYGHNVTAPYTISNGIVFNESGYPVSVFIADFAPEHSFCSVANGNFYPLFKPWQPELGGVVLSMQLKRSTSSRRQPWLSAAVRPHDEIDDVFVAVRIALRNAACRATYTKVQDWEAFSEWMKLADPTVGTAQPVAGLTHAPNPGDHVYFNPGEEGGVFETNAPGANFDDFIKLQMTTLGLPIGMCIEESARIFQKSFSASRMAINSTRRRYERRQPQIKRRKVTPCLLFAIACHQKLKLLPPDPRCKMILCAFPGWPYMEPLTDAQASEILINTKQTSRHTLQAEVGIDFQAEVPLIQAEDLLFPPQAAAPRTNNFINAGGAN